jgi:hypothetical protein
MRAVSSLTGTALTSLELWGCSKVTDERMRAEHLPAHVQRTQAGLRREAAASPSTRRSFCEVRRAAEGAGSTLSRKCRFFLMLEVPEVGCGRFGPFLCHFHLLALAFHPSGWGLVSDSGTIACLELLW